MASPTARSTEWTGDSAEIGAAVELYGVSDWLATPRCRGLPLPPRLRGRARPRGRRHGVVIGRVAEVAAQPSGDANPLLYFTAN